MQEDQKDCDEHKGEMMKEQHNEKAVLSLKALCCCSCVCIFGLKAKLSLKESSTFKNQVSLMGCNHSVLSRFHLPLL